MSSAWSFTVAKVPNIPASPQHRPGDVMLMMEFRLDLLPPEIAESERRPQSLFTSCKNFAVAMEKLQRDGEGFFARLFSQLPAEAPVENLDIHGFTERVMSLAAAGATLRVKLKLARVLPSDEIRSLLQEHFPTVNPDVGEERREELCSICLEKLGRREVATMRCSHLFHNRCIRRWLRGLTHLTCPLCRSPAFVPV